MKTEYEKEVEAHQAKMAMVWKEPLTNQERAAIEAGTLKLSITGPSRFEATIKQKEAEIAKLQGLLLDLYLNGAVAHHSNPNFADALKRARAELHARGISTNGY